MSTFDEQRTPLEKHIDREVLARVRAGIKLLEEKYGPDWVSKVEPRGLNLMSGSACVLGQVYAAYVDEGYTDADGDQMVAHNGFEYGRHVLGIAGSDAEYGFVSGGESWADLTEAWRQEIDLILSER